MHRGTTRSSQHALPITASLVALVLLIAGLFVIPGQGTGWVTTAGIVLLAATGCYSWWLGQTQRRVSVHRDRTSTHLGAERPERTAEHGSSRHS